MLQRKRLKRSRFDLKCLDGSSQALSVSRIVKVDNVFLGRRMNLKIDASRKELQLLAVEWDSRIYESVEVQRYKFRIGPNALLVVVRSTPKTEQMRVSQNFTYQ